MREPKWLSSFVYCPLTQPTPAGEGLTQQHGPRRSAQTKTRHFHELDPPKLDTKSSLSDTLSAALHQHFDFDTFRPGQKEVIRHLLEGYSAAAVFPTGGGKSLCYQLPAILPPGVTLLVSPLIALIKDQIDALAVKRHRDAAARLPF